jgi:uncharacterized protein YfaS (alpha-2-macroglobulin family)
MRRLLLIALLLLAHPAFTFELPGLEGDSARYEESLTRRHPAGGTPQARAAAETRARAAESRADWPGAVAAWEERVALGQAGAEVWMALGRAQLRRTPPDGARALHAGWRAFMRVPGGPPEIPSLLLMAEALRLQDRAALQLQALEAVVERAPEDAAYRAQLAAARRAAGLLVRRWQVEPDAEPARACLHFTAPPARRADWTPADWVRTEPPLPDLAVVREADALCLAGLPWGSATRVTLRAGLPGEDGLRLARDTSLSIAMPNRAARILFDQRAFVLPRGQAQALTVATINVTALRLQLVRVSERNLTTLTRDWRPGTDMDDWIASYQLFERGQLVWEGRAELAGTQPNQIARSRIALPDALRSAGPGLYVLVAQAADGQRLRALGTAAILATDLGLTAWRSNAAGDGGLAVQVRGFQDAAPRPGLRVALLAENNDILASAETDAEGLVRFGAALLRGTGPQSPAALHAFDGDDFAALDLRTAAFDLTDRGAEGRAHPGPLDAFVWLDRGIYRPGETVHVSALLRDAAGAPAELPARLRIRRPNGQIFFDAVPARHPGGAILAPVTLSAGAATGAWTVEVLAAPDAPPIGRASFKVEAFVPERLAVTAGPASGPLVPGRALDLPVSARFLYGAPGGGLTGAAELRLAHDPEPWPSWRGWRFGLADEAFTPDLLSFDIPETDAEGRSTLTLRLDGAPDTSRPVRAEIAIQVNEPGGRASGTRLTLPVRPAGTTLAIRPGFQGDAIDADAEAGFEIAAIDPDGGAEAARLRLRLVRERPEWRIVMRERLARYETVWRDEPVDSAEIDVTPANPGRFARRLPFGRYRVEVTDGAMAIASYRFRAGWAQAESAEVPDRVDVAADRRVYGAGEVARLSITPPFAGRASVAVLTDRVLSLRDVEVPAAGAEVMVPVDPAWGPGAHVSVTLFRPGSARDGRPGRALGLAWLALDPGPRQLAVAIDTPELVRPESRIEVPVRITGAAAGTAMLTLAAVDEGILSLTRFQSPDPVAHFLARRRLGLDIRDDYGRLIAPADGAAALLRQGGDGFDAISPIQPPQRILALFQGPVAVGADGVARVPLDLPDFAGEVRLMVVAWAGNQVGSASKPLTVRPPIVAEPLLPRFLAPGDQARLSLLVHNVELPEGPVELRLTAAGAISLDGQASFAPVLASGARTILVSGLRADLVGEGVLTLAVASPHGFTAHREARITVRSARPAVTEVAVATLAPGASAPVPVPSDRFLPGTWRATALWGAPVRYEPAAMLAALKRFPLDCVEQAGARLLALVHAPADPDLAAEDRAALGAAINSVLDRQRYDGRFGLWSAEGEVHPWASLFATEALLRARMAGAPVPDVALMAVLQAEDEALSIQATSPADLAAQAYRLHVLGLAGRHRLGAARRLAENLDRLPTPLARAQLAAAFARAGDRARAEAIFAAALADPTRNPWWGDYGSAARDALATALLLKESGVAAERLPALLARLPGADLRPERMSTQEQAWAVAAAAVLGRDGRPARVALDGANLPVAAPARSAITRAGTATNRGDAPLVQTVAITGVPTSPLPATAQGMRVARRFFQVDGTPLNLDALRAGTNFILLLEARATDGDRHEAMVMQGLPAGFEITGRLPAGDVPGLGFLGTLSAPLAMPARDEAFAAAIVLTPEQPLARFAVRLRAVTQGSFELPGAEAQDMYRPGILARQNVGRITVLPAE